MQTATDPTNTSESFATSDRPPARPFRQQGERQDRPICSLCKSRGRRAFHASSECWQQHPEKKPTRRPAPKASSHATVSSTSGSVFEMEYCFATGDLCPGLGADKLLMDNGSTQHVVNNLSSPFVDATTYKPFLPGQGVPLGAGLGDDCQALGTVDIAVRVPTSDRTVVVLRFPGALYVPTFKTNVVSEAQAVKQGLNYATSGQHGPHLVLPSTARSPQLSEASRCVPLQVASNGLRHF